VSDLCLVAVRGGFQEGVKTILLFCSLWWLLLLGRSIVLLGVRDVCLVPGKIRGRKIFEHLFLNIVNN